MDRKLSKKPEIERLIHLSASARSSLEQEAILLRQRLDIPTRVRESLKHHPAGWLLGSLASGLTASLLLRRKSAPEKKTHRGLPLTLLSLTFTAVRPLAKVWLTNQVKHYLARRSVAVAPSRQDPYKFNPPETL